MRTGVCRLSDVRRLIAGALRALAGRIDPPAPVRDDYFTRRLAVVRAEALVFEADRQLEMARERLEAR
jgi:hypothetical protein